MQEQGEILKSPISRGIIRRKHGLSGYEEVAQRDERYLRGRNEQITKSTKNSIYYQGLNHKMLFRKRQNAE
jgi:hypothetical protein